MARQVSASRFFSIVFVVVDDDAGESEMEKEGRITADNYYRSLCANPDWIVIHLSNNKLHDLRTYCGSV